MSCGVASAAPPPPRGVAFGGRGPPGESLATASALPVHPELPRLDVVRMADPECPPKVAKQVKAVHEIEDESREPTGEVGVGAVLHAAGTVCGRPAGV